MPNTVPAAASGLPMPRSELERLIEEAIAVLDLLDADPDLEETGDLEPSLGAYYGNLVDGELDTADHEPSLGSPETWLYGGRQTNWAAGNQQDLEQECEDEGAQCDDDIDTDFEPSLGSLDGRENQEGWAGGVSGDLEDEVRAPSKHKSKPESYSVRLHREAAEARATVRRVSEIVARVKGREAALAVRS